jgi:hypothetical protein
MSPMSRDAVLFHVLGASLVAGAIGLAGCTVQTETGDPNAVGSDDAIG